MGIRVAVGSGVGVSVDLAACMAASMVACISAVGSGSGSKISPAGGRGSQHQYQPENQYQARRSHSPHPFTPDRPFTACLLPARTIGCRDDGVGHHRCRFNLTISWPHE